MNDDKFDFTDLIVLLLELTIFGLAIAGVVLASIDFAHAIFNSKSICFMIFGILGILICLPSEIVIKIKSTNKQNKQDIESLKNKISVLEMKLESLKEEKEEIEKKTDKPKISIKEKDLDELLLD